MSHSALAEQTSEGPATRHVALVEVRQADPPGAEDQCRAVGVLVIEDDKLMRRSLEQGLKKRGFAVWAAADGGEGAELYRRFGAQIDVVLSDLNMPVLDGPQTLDSLRRINPLVRFCFMTADVRQSTLTGLLKLGALRVFTKPFSSVAEVAEELRELAARPPVAFSTVED
ncbi:response regulator, partial [bacterium]|nr:response regulator [bacterium]